jgi:hypothetical protein
MLMHGGLQHRDVLVPPMRAKPREASGFDVAR